MLERLDKIFIKIESTICVISFLAMVAVVVWSVICRYFLRIKFIYAEELTRYLTIYAIFFGTSLAVKERAHVGVEAFVNLLSQKKRDKLCVVTDILTCLVYAVMLVLSIGIMQHYASSGQTTTLTKIPMWAVYFCVPAGMFLSVLHSLTQIIQKITKQQKMGEKEAAE